MRHSKRKTDWRKATKKVWQATQLYYQGDELPKILADADPVTLTEWEVAAERLLRAITHEKGRRRG